MDCTFLHGSPPSKESFANEAQFAAALGGCILRNAALERVALFLLTINRPHLPALGGACGGCGCVVL
ncbi:MAG: hypothetical protein JWM04_1586 [Verrucomicrobiales bacterium]|nr:hypothetical protein [Verrucomicrobiales bacterium]